MGQPENMGIICIECDPGHSTNGVAGYTGSECPACEQHFYCNHMVDENCRSDDAGCDTTPCGSCDECTIAEYTDGVGAKNPSKCMTFGALFGFGYPTQCIIIWLIFGAIFLLCCGGWGTKCYIAHKSGHVSINNGDLSKSLMDDCDDGLAPMLEAHCEDEQWERENNLSNSGLVTF